MTTKAFPCTAPKCKLSFDTERGRNRHVAISHKSNKTLEAYEELKRDHEILEQNEEHLAQENNQLRAAQEGMSTTIARLTDDKNVLSKMVRDLQEDLTTAYNDIAAHQKRVQDAANNELELMRKVIELQETLLIQGTLQRREA